eukprot:CAMPEP_0119037292 /NCGR_PEP_ID=MMETSP1177-20130426/5570_1 /TAXON_ID=2985 /ORGANISM="Ochromonas sp, Strain CCMP1899" /LENGTH=365 /DNA_ID=CAMNT_0006998361 /DNA_START=69 /DNA_END=1163 /DNA_ORIENTATION=+
MAGEKEEGECSDDEVVETSSTINVNLLSNTTGRVGDALTRNSNIDLINLKLEVFRTMANKNRIKKQQKHNIKLEQESTQIVSKFDTSSAINLRDNYGRVENDEESSSDMEMENWEVFAGSSEEQEDIDFRIQRLNNAKNTGNRVEDVSNMDYISQTKKKGAIDMNVVLRERMAKLAQEAAAKAMKSDDTIIDTITIRDENMNAVNNLEAAITAILPNSQNSAFSTIFYFEEGEKLDIFDLASNEKKNKRSKMNKSGGNSSIRPNGSSTETTATFTYWHGQEQVKDRPDRTVVRVSPVVEESTLSKRDSDIIISNNNALIQPRLSIGTAKRSFSAIAASSSSSFSSISHDLTVEANTFTSQAGVDP